MTTFPRLRRRTLAVLTAIAFALALAGFASHTAAHAASPPPGTNYRMYDSSCTFGGPCREQITIYANPNNVAVRAWINCYNAVPNTYTTQYSNWHTAVGFAMITGSCDGYGRSSDAGIQWNKTALYTRSCWARGQDWGPRACS